MGIMSEINDRTAWESSCVEERTAGKQLAFSRSSFYNESVK